MSHFALTFSITFLQGIGVEMERLAAKMGGTVKWPYNDSECLDAEFFKVKKKTKLKIRLDTEMYFQSILLSVPDRC